MGKVIPFVIVAPCRYPAVVNTLDVAERVLLRALRQWVLAFRRAEAPLPQLCGDLAAEGVEDAAFSVDALMRVIARTARRTVGIQCLRCAAVSPDEQCLLYAASAAQAGDAERAERVLRTALLTAQGAEFALGPIEGLGDVFALAGLFFRHRLPPVDAGPAEAWTPAMPLLRH